MQYSMKHAPGGLSKEEAKEQSKDGFGACDAMLAASIIYPEDGSLSMLFISLDGRTGEPLEDIEWFKVLTLLAARLAKSKTIGEGRRAFCEVVNNAISNAVIKESCDVTVDGETIVTEDHLN